MPQRFLRPGLTNSDRWNAVSFEAQSLFVRLLTLVDDFGRYDGRVAVLHGQCFALRNDVKPQRTAALRSELHEAGLINVYAVDGKDYVQVEKWQERARGDKSKYPPPPTPQDSAADCAQSAALRSAPLAKDASLATTSSPLHPRSSPSPLDAVASGFEDFWQAYPRRVARPDAEKAWVKQKCPELLPKILVAIRDAKISADWTKDGGQYIPHPATWINRRGWEDELIPKTAATTNQYGRNSAHNRTAADRERERTGIEPASIPTNFL